MNRLTLDQMSVIEHFLDDGWDIRINYKRADEYAFLKNLRIVPTRNSDDRLVKLVDNQWDPNILNQYLIQLKEEQDEHYNHMKRLIDEASKV